MTVQTRVYIGEADTEVRPADWQLLNEEERGRAKRFFRPADTAHYVAAHANARRSIGRHLDADPRDVDLGRRLCPGCGSDQHGPPVVTEPSNSCHISLSRSGRHHAIAISGHPVGVDIESRGRDVGYLVATALTAAERALWESAPKHVRDDVLVRWWARKEALVKALGLGLGADVSAYDLSGGRLPESSGDVDAVTAHSAGRDWSIYDVRVSNSGFVVSLAVEGRRGAGPSTAHPVPLERHVGTAATA